MIYKVGKLQSAVAALPVVFALIFMTSCKPEGFINKVKYGGEKYINTCETFSKDLDRMIKNNNDPTRLVVSQYDNSDFDYYYLEPGQFEIYNDTLFFRLASDLKYAQYLYKGVAVHVNASYQALSEIEDLEGEDKGELGTLVIDESYYASNRKPFFIYKIPLNDVEMEGKQLYLTFSIVKYKKGEIKDVYCNSQSEPLGPLTPSCCTAKAWELTKLQSVVDFPEVPVNEETFKYKAFEGTIDLIFEEGEAEYSDSLIALEIQKYIDKFKGFDYKASEASIKGYASPGGDEEANKELSEERAQTVKAALKDLNKDNRTFLITGMGMGEDWDRIKALTQKSSLSSDQKDQVLAIANQSITNDEKEAELRKLPFWEQLVEEVLIKTRHTYVELEFKYNGDKMTLKRYAETLPLNSSALEDVATTEIKVVEFDQSSNPQEDLKTVNELLRTNASANLYAMRSTYNLSQGMVDKAIDDLRKASELSRDAANNPYEQAIQEYKVIFADTYNFEERRKLLDEYNALAQNNPSDRKLFFDRAILMDKVWFISGALDEYEALLEGRPVTASQYNNRGVARIKTNMYTKAAADFNKAIELDEKLSEAYFNLAILYAYQGLTLKTIDNLDKALELEPDHKERIMSNPAFSVMMEDPVFDKYK